jgi:hypothetical protein
MGDGMRALVAGFVLLLIGVSAHAQVYHGNDAVTLSVGNEFEAHLIAAQFCARGDKYSIIRVHRRHGDEIAINCLAAPPVPQAAPPAPRSASIPTGQPATNKMTELFAQFQRAVTTLSTAAQPERPAGEQALFAQFKRALTALSTAGQIEMPASEKDPLPRPEHDGTDTPNTYAQAW